MKSGLNDLICKKASKNQKPSCFFWFLHEQSVATKDSSLVSVSLRKGKRFECSLYLILVSSFLIANIFRKGCQQSPIGNILYDFFYFLKLFEGNTRKLDANQIKHHLSSCYVSWKSEMLAGKPGQLLILTSAPTNIPPNKKKTTVYVNL